MDWPSLGWGIPWWYFSVILLDSWLVWLSMSKFWFVVLILSLLLWVSSWSSPVVYWLEWFGPLGSCLKDCARQLSTGNWPDLKSSFISGLFFLSKVQSMRTGSMQTGSMQTGSMQTGSVRTGSMGAGSMQTGHSSLMYRCKFQFPSREDRKSGTMYILYHVSVCCLKSSRQQCLVIEALEL